jgi:hypothetical protein
MLTLYSVAVFRVHSVVETAGRCGMLFLELEDMFGCWKTGGGDNAASRADDRVAIQCVRYSLVVIHAPTLSYTF